MAHFVVFLCMEQLITYRLQNSFRATIQNDWHDLKNHNSEILFIGGSSAMVEINPFEVSDKFGVKAEILSQDAQSIDLLWQKFQQYLAVNYPPKEIYILYNPITAGIGNNLLYLDHFKSYFFMDRYNIGKLKNKDGYHIYYKYLPLLAVGTQSLQFIFNFPTRNTYEKTRGYLPQHATWLGNWKYPPDNIDFNLKGLDYIDSFVSICHKKNITCYFIYPPVSPASYRLLSKYKQFENRLYLLHANQRNYNSNTLYNDSTLFYNHTHLNEKGVQVFMKQLLNDSTVFNTFRH